MIPAGSPADGKSDRCVAGHGAVARDHYPFALAHRRHKAGVVLPVTEFAMRNPFNAMNLPRILWAVLFGCLAAFSLQSQTAPDFSATHQSEATGDRVLHWPSQSVQRYHIESSPWTVLPGEFTGTGGKLSASNCPVSAAATARQLSRMVSTAGRSVLYYVSTTGVDANPGSSNQPWRTLRKAANTLGPGETAIVRSGFYDEVLTLNRGGTSDTARVSVVSETLHGAKCKRIVIKADYVCIDAFEVEEEAIEAGVSIHGSDHTVVSHCYIHDCPENGISLRHATDGKLPSHFILSGNRIEHNGQVGIRIKGSHGLVENNTISRTVAYHPKTTGIAIRGTDADGMHVFGEHHVIRNNIIANLGDPAENDIAGARAPHVDFFQSWDRAAVAPSEVIMGDCLIENNYCWSTHPYSKGLIIESVDGTMGAHDITVRNNVFEFRDAGIFLQQFTAGFPHRKILVYNNIFTARLGDGPWGGAVRMNGVVDYQVFNNIMVNCHPVIRQITGTGFIDYNFAWYSDGSTVRFTTPAAQAHEAVGDPGFACFSGVHGGNDYHFSSDSALIDRGNPVTPTSCDLDGGARPLGAGFDPGPYEYGNRLRDKP